MGKFVARDDGADESVIIERCSDRVDVRVDIDLRRGVVDAINLEHSVVPDADSSQVRGRRKAAR